MRELSKTVSLRFQVGYAPLSTLRSDPPQLKTRGIGLISAFARFSGHG